jgi:hypothetical protein
LLRSKVAEADWALDEMIKNKKPVSKTIGFEMTVLKNCCMESKNFTLSLTPRCEMMVIN